MILGNNKNTNRDKELNGREIDIKLKLAFKNFNCWFILILFITFLLKANTGICLVSLIPETDVFFTENNLTLYVGKSDWRNVAVGPIYGNYFESDDSGASFEIVASITNPDLIYRGTNPFYDYYRLECGSNTIKLSVKQPDIQVWSETNLSKFMDLLARVYKLGEDRYGPLNLDYSGIKLKLVPLIGFLIIVFLAMLINSGLERSRRNYYVEPTIAYFAGFYYLFIFVIPQFTDIFQSFSPARIPSSTLCLILSTTSYYGLFLHTLALGFFAPCIFFQLKHVLSVNKAAFLKAAWISFFLIYLATLSMIIFMPL